MASHPTFRTRRAGPLSVGVDPDFDRSDAPAVVLLHGLSSWGRQFEPLLPFLAPEWRVVGVDLPGFGRSDPLPDRGFDLGDVSEAVRAALEDVGLDRVRLCGHSMGATVATRVALDAPERVESLVLLAPAGLVAWRTRGEFAPPGRAQMAARGVALGLAVPAVRAVPRLRRLGFSRLVGDPADLSGRDAATLVEGARRAGATGAARHAMASAGIGDVLPRVQVPIELVWGDRDRLVPIGWAQKLRGSIGREVPLHVVPGAGHVLGVEQPAAVAAGIAAHAWRGAPVTA